MTFGEATRYCLAHLNDYTGRARRSEFWWYYLALYLASLVVNAILLAVLFAAVFGAAASESSGSSELGGGAIAVFIIFYGLIFVFALLSIWLMLAAQARRLHDAGYSGHYLWFHLAGLSIVPTILCIMEGQPYANQWGPDPKAGERFAYPGATAGGFPPPPAFPPAFPQTPPGPARAPGSDPFAAPE